MVIVRALILGAILVGVMVISAGCLFEKVEGEIHTDNEVVEAEGAEKVEVRIQFVAGDLRIDSDSDELLNSSMKYGASIRDPRIKYEVRGSTGELLIQDRERRASLNFGGFDTEWMLSFSPDIPLELELEFGAGTSRLDLADLDLLMLGIETGAGSANVNLVGNWDHDVDIDIEQGVGEVTLHLPSTMPVRVDVDRGIGVIDADDFKLLDGDYVNDAYDESEDLPTITVNIEQGVGATILRLKDPPAPSRSEDETADELGEGSTGDVSP